MKIIISPAKKMEECDDIFAPGGFPKFLDRTKVLFHELKAMTEPELKALFKANDAITRENFIRYQSMDLERAMSPALLTYIGIQYQYMAPKLFSHDQWEYVNSHLRILSGFYGILRPDDRVMPYRLEMQTKLSVAGKKDLYDFWGSALFDELRREEGESTVILNLASKEYSKAIEAYLTPEVRFVTCVFGVPDDSTGTLAADGRKIKGRKIKIKATEAKMARGEMVRYMAENGIEKIEDIQAFSRLGYRYSEEDSKKDCFVYLKQ